MAARMASIAVTAVGGGGAEIAANPAPSGEGGQGVPAAGHCLVPLCGLGAAL